MSIMSGFSDRFRALRQEHSLTQQALADRLGTSKSSVNMYERGEREPGFKTLEAIADFFNVDMDYLLGKSEVKNRSVSDPPAEFIPFAPTHRIPILGRIRAGLPLYAEEHVEGYTYTELNGGAEYFALRVTGDSMNAARIGDGDTLIVRRQECVDNGQIAVVLVGDDEATVKRFFCTGHTVTLMPQSTNPIHQPQIYDTRDIQIRIVGLVVQSMITF